MKKVQSKQKHALRIMFNQTKSSPSEPFLLSLNVLNVYQVSIFQSVQFMHKTKYKNVSHVFLKLFSVPCHTYSTNSSLINFSVPWTFLKTTRFAISDRGPILWNNWLSKNEQEIDNCIVQKRAKEEIIELIKLSNSFQ